MESYATPLVWIRRQPVCSATVDDLIMTFFSCFFAAAVLCLLGFFLTQKEIHVSLAVAMSARVDFYVSDFRHANL